ncbi:MAG: MFS transporter [Pseudomonadales bacterium]
MNRTRGADNKFFGWRMVALGFAAQNIAIGTTFGSYGVLIKPVTEEFHAPRSVAALGIALITLLMGVVSPALGAALDRRSIRGIMSIGALLMAGGFVVASMAGNMTLFLLSFGVLIGLGSAMLGTLPAMTLVNNWFIDNRGLAIGIVSIPLVVAVAPPAVAALISWLDWRSTLLVLGAMGILLLPFLWLVVNRPEDIGQCAYRNADDTANSGSVAEESGDAFTNQWTIATLLRSRRYWALVIFAGMVISGGIVIVTHIFAHATDAGISAQSAAILLSINGVCAMVGAFAFGWIADKLGPALAICLAAIVQLVAWSLLLTTTNFMFLSLIMTGIGLSGGGAHPAFAALLAQEFGQTSFGTALGLGALLMLPLTFAAAPFAGFLYDLNGNYALAFQIHIALFCAAALFFFGISRRTPLTLAEPSNIQ